MPIVGSEKELLEPAPITLIHPYSLFRSEALYSFNLTLIWGECNAKILVLNKFDCIR